MAEEKNKKVKIKLGERWYNGDRLVERGEVIEIDEATAEGLKKDGVKIEVIK